MDKETLSNYGWIVICVLVLAVMIALATPFGEFIKDGIKSTTQGLFDVNLKAMESAGIVAPGEENDFYQYKDVEFDGVDQNTVWSSYFHGTAFNGYDTFYKSVKKGEKYRVTNTVVRNEGYAAVIICDTDNNYVDSVMPYTSDMDTTVSAEFVVPCDGYIRVCTQQQQYQQSYAKPALQQYLGDTFEPDSIKTYSIEVDSTTATIRTKYDAENDIVFVFGKGGGNNLPDFRDVYTISNTINTTTTKLATTRMIYSVGDMFGPHVVGAYQNADGDKPNSYYFTGGNHQSNNQASGGTVTARNESFEVIADGKTVTGKAYCNNVTLKWTNYIQAFNTTKSAGGGREVLKEDVVITMKGPRVEVSITHTALEKVSRYTYYGLQLMKSGFSTIQYIGGESNAEYNISDSSSSGNLTSRSYIVKTSAGNTCEIGVYNTGLGDFAHSSPNKSAFTSGDKVYFGLICNGGAFVQDTGETTLVKGYYDFTKK